MSRTRVRRRRTLTVMAVLACLLVTGPVSRAFAPHREPRHPHRVYVVQPGDTVWSIAAGIAGSGDPRPLVDAIARRNHVDPGSIVPGQSLVIPAVG